MEAASVLAVLHDSPIGASLTRPARQRLLRLGRIRQAAAGDVLLSEGAETSELGIVRRGRAALRLAVPGRGTTTVMTVEPGDALGWSAVVPPYPATSTVVAVEPLEAAVFAADSLRAALRHDDELAAAIHEALLRVVARRLTATRLQLLDLFAVDPGMAW
jgi:CRP-like cAMP-binding protein